jgi:hypothetical protein
MESVAECHWNRWPNVHGIGGRMGPEYADVLYMSFRKPQRATATIETDDDILIRKDGKDIVGLTILNTSSR